jgi:uncharacterized protein (TIGR02246 family)
MLKWTALVLIVTFATPAFADATADAKTHSEAFAKACEAGDVPGVMALYTDDATVVWPGAGEEAKGKAKIEKLVTNLCNPKNNPKLVNKSIEGIALGDSHIVTVGHWDVSLTDANGKRTTSHVRTTEVIVKSGAGWRYVVDHASIGLPPPKAAAKAGAKATQKK